MTRRQIEDTPRRDVGPLIDAFAWIVAALFVYHVL